MEKRNHIPGCGSTGGGWYHLIQKGRDFVSRVLHHGKEPPGSISQKDINMITPDQLEIIKKTYTHLGILIQVICDDKTGDRSEQIALINSTSYWRIFLKQLLRKRDIDTLHEIYKDSVHRSFYLNVSSEEGSVRTTIHSEAQREPYKHYFQSKSITLRAIPMPFDICFFGEYIDDDVIAMELQRKTNTGERRYFPFHLTNYGLLHLIDALAKKNCSLSSLLIWED